MTTTRSIPTSRPATTTRVVLPGLVEPAGLLLETAPMPVASAGELLVAVEATGISFAEQSMRRGRYFGQPAFPFTPGYDLVGTVLAAGDAGNAGLVGRRVATMTKTGAWAGHAAVQARDSIVVPDEISSEDAETVVVNGVTAWQMLHRSAKVTAGQTILLFGANGGVGGILIQLARHAGVRVIGAAASRHHDALRAAGVIPVDYSDPDLAAQVRAIAPTGVDAVFDNVGGAMTRTAWTLLAPGGTLVTYSIITAVSGSGPLIMPFLKAIGQALLWSALPNGRSATFYDLWAGHRARPARFRRHLEHDLGQVFALVADGTIVPNIAARFPLAEVAAALTLAESRTLNGKVILLP
ncbi:medium chain dehydrogenase/reductase family protein [Cryobacterium sp. SO2]|uniref:medium chain dehydrogenase/reductase family protein n=1 Tax=Cryobacterium sp. SO2 TaxID=1897060 RepID=UPI00223E427A|nr:medium chain dehydrogenase/reductase family protein [Cryobacterium sp. SO2]WEO77350.1 medium chain dehydrogenase/reductase family protein [Cryobacterium sp. SO2]